MPIKSLMAITTSVLDIYKNFEKLLKVLQKILGQFQTFFRIFEYNLMSFDESSGNSATNLRDLRNTLKISRKN